MTSLRSPGLSSQSVSGCSGQKRPKKPETDWDDNPGKPRLVIPVDFGVFWPKGAKKPRNGLGSPGFSSQSVSGFSGQKEPKKPETDWDDKSGKPRLVIPVRFRVSRPKRTTKPRNGLGRRAWEAQVCPCQKGPKKPETDWDDKPGKPRLIIPVRFGVFWPKRAQQNPKRTGIIPVRFGQKGPKNTRNGLG